MHDGKQPDPQDLVQFASAYLMRYKEAKQHFATVRPPESPRQWSPPSGAKIKINVDAAIFTQSNAAGLGIVARNSAGEVIAWRQRLVHSVLCPDTAETLVVLESVRMAVDFGWQEVIIESDCLSVINAINSMETCLTAAHHFVDEIKTLVSLFRCISFQHIFRLANNVAHELARQVVRDLDGTQLP